MPGLEHLPGFQCSSYYLTDEGAEALEGTTFDQANFLYQNALESNFSFHAILKQHLKKIGKAHSGGIESNLMKIISKIQKAPEQNLFMVCDMIKATIIAETPEELISIYDHLEKHPYFEIIQIKNGLKGPLTKVELNLIFQRKILCEITLEYGAKPMNYGAHCFLQELSNSETVQEFRQLIYTHLAAVAGCGSALYVEPSAEDRAKEKQRAVEQAKDDDEDYDEEKEEEDEEADENEEDGDEDDQGEDAEEEEGEGDQEAEDDEEDEDEAAER